MEREVELTNGEKIIVKAPGMNGEILVWDLITCCEPLVEQFQRKHGGQSITKTRLFFSLAGLMKDNWANLGGVIVSVVKELTGMNEEKARNDLTIADKIAILYAGWDVMGLGKLTEALGIKAA